MAAYMKPEKSGTTPMRKSDAPGYTHDPTEVLKISIAVPTAWNRKITPASARVSRRKVNEPLNRHGSEHEEGIAGKPGTLGMDEVGGEQQAEQQRAKQARPALLDGEADKFVEPERGGAPIGPIADGIFHLDEVRQRRPDAGGAVRAGLRRRAILVLGGSAGGHHPDRCR